ncbi:MAG: alpha/beta hydrolase [Sphingomonadaceae bacterium]
MSAQYEAHRYRSACGRLELFARDYPGDGPPLLLMHGLTRNSADFEGLAEHLAGRFRLIVPDQRGRGLSQNDPESANYRPDVYAGDMFALLGSLGIERAHLIGTSMGGLMAMVMAVTQPARVGAIILNDVGPELDLSGLERIKGYIVDPRPMESWDACAERCAAINGDAFPDYGPEDWLAFARRTAREDEDGQIVLAYDPAIAGPLVDAPPEEAVPDLWPVWDMLAEKPVLVVRGANSDLLAPATLTKMAERHSGPFASVEVPDRAHAPMLDEPVALEAIDGFLAEHAA